MKDGFIRVAAATPEIQVADCRYNREQIEKMMEEAWNQEAGMVVFPELCLTGYTCGDLFFGAAFKKMRGGAGCSFESFGRQGYAHGCRYAAGSERKII